MVAALRHRGPDDSGFRLGDVCALGHARLSIIDLSPAGRQPLSNEDGSVWLVFNGEIYNFQSLRGELENLGHGFRTRTDSEVVVHAYEQWGAESVKRLRGMFAFAIWDEPRRRLFIARDRVGKKPLYYTTAGRRFWFASEIQGLLADDEVPREADPAAIDSYLSWGYVPAPRTGFKNIFKLEPAHWMTVDAEADGFAVRTERYWSLSYGPKLSLTDREAAEAVREKLTEAVRLRMISDVPLGAFLSGGIDSSIVVGLMAGLSAGPVKTFSIGFDEASYDELPHARRVADRWSTDHHEMTVKPDAAAILPKLARHYGEPYADSSAVPTYYVSQMTRSTVTVAINGDGGDESFAGYERYLGARLAEMIGGFPAAPWSAKMLSRAIPDSAGPKSRLRKAKRFLSVAAEPMGRRYARWVGYFDQDEKHRLYTRDFKMALNGSRPVEWIESLFDAAEEMDPVDAAMYVDVSSYLPYDLLAKVDVASMANSLEARSPFLDHEVMELAARLPSSYKLRGRMSKHILKQAFTDLLPPENLSRRKMGFGVPAGEWFRGDLLTLLNDSILSATSLSSEYVDVSEVRRLADEHLCRRAERGNLLWSLLMLELWLRELVKC
jgi:asparagine synthase (glutamine-hydrolysing)